MKKKISGKQLLLSYLISLTVMYTSCSEDIACPQFDFAKVNLDSTKIKDTIIFYNKINSDSLIFLTSKEFVSIDSINESILNTRGCDNGIRITYSDTNNNFIGTNFIIKSNLSYNVSIYSYDFYFNTVFEKMDEINFDIPNINTKGEFQYGIYKKITIRKGLLVGFVDSTDIFWESSHYDI